MHTTTTTPTARYEAAGYTVDILVQGYPGKSVCHGSLGWSTIALLRGHGRVALIDVGSFGVRGTLIAKLADHGLSPESVTDVILTHSHYDHAINWTLFAHAEGKGFAFEAARAARAFAAQAFKLDGVISYIRADNTRSAALATRLGATYERDGTVMGTACHIWRHPKEAA